MIAENTSIMEEKFNFESKVRDRRLTDIRRGQRYLRRIDNLAATQWKSNEPRLGHVRRTNYVTIRPITDSVHSKAQNERLMREGFNGDFLSSTPKQRVQSERALSDFRKDATISGNFEDSQFHRSSPRSKLSFPDYMVSPGGKKRFLEPIQRDLYNPYGSNYSPLDEKTELTHKDMEPRYEPIRFRETNPRVVKPLPKKYPPMSRIASEDKDRSLRYDTNFRSTRNGVLNVIHPPETFPDPVRTNTLDRIPNLTDIKNEKTFVLMRRLNHFINPNKKEKSSLGSSEEDLPPSKSPCVSDISDDVPSEYQNITDKARGPQKTMFFPDNELSEKPIYPMYHKNLYHPRVKKKIVSFGDSLAELNKRPMDLFRKCRIWASTCSQYSSC
ncbi:uncharacterized protein LOC125670126 [Ostrea edulis]|uniref:uncharacterized protein LOC125670126 n=1 Tax=Ostrea edulis TaxID=37623 RepID=UPI0024AEEAF5|nr:uncharacterized protein LOC125670126 [Ostrea edulis]XP_048761065.2 uncharacterized protein LOC125670126 [Ostrea edulis]